MQMVVSAAVVLSSSIYYIPIYCIILGIPRTSSVMGKCGSLSMQLHTDTHLCLHMW